MLEANKIYHGDNLSYLENMPNKCIDLVYIDPPFGTQTLQKSRTWNEKIQGAVFYGLWSGGVHGYMQFLSGRLRHIHRILKPSGSLFLHLDWRMAHYAKIELDKIFGMKNFINEIIWHYDKWTNAASHFQKNHDTILYYAKHKGKHTFNKLYSSKISPHYEKGYHTNVVKSGDNGRLRQLIVYDPIKAKKQIESDKFDKVVYRDKQTKVALPDVWQIPIINPMAKERLGNYPTQKPLVLLERIVESASNKGDLVMDCFCGCGTTIEAAYKLGRDWIGIDASMLACKEMQKRMKERQKTIVPIHKQILTKDEFMKLSPFEFEKATVRAIGGVANTKQVGDDGVDGMLSSDWTPIQVKKSENIGRPVLDAFYKHISEHKAKRGVIIALSFSKGIKEEKARLEREKSFDIQLLTLDNIIKGNYREEQKLI